MSYSRKKGLEISNGEYILFVDADDYLLPNAIKSLVHSSEKENVDIVYGRMKRRMGPVCKGCEFSTSLPTNTKISGKELFEKYYISFFGINILPVNMFACLYRKSTINNALKHTQLFSEIVTRMGEDEYFNLKLFPYINSVYAITDYVYVYRWGGITSGFNPKINQLYDLSDIRIKLLDKYKYEKGYQPLFIEYANILISELRQKSNYSREQCISYLKEEISNRYLVKRMKDFYNKSNTVPQKISLIVNEDYNGFYELVKSYKKENRLRKIAKWCLSKLN